MSLRRLLGEPLLHFLLLGALLSGLAGMGAGIQPFVNVPIVDSVTAGTHWALRSHVTPPQRATPGFDVPWVNLSAELTGMGLR